MSDAIAPPERLVLLHGFTQTGRSWDPLRETLATRFEVLTPDLPGHGGRTHMRAGLWEAAAAVGDECGPANYLGYSMGGRVALHLALARPELVHRLVLVGATAGIEDDSERAARRNSDEALARTVEADGVAPFLERWLTQPMFADLTAEAAGLDARLENEAAGLAASLRQMGTGVQEPLWHRLGELTMPVLLLVGERDDAFAEVALRMGAWIGGAATLALVPGAGHACHLERPDAFVDLVLSFLAEGHGHEEHGV